MAGVNLCSESAYMDVQPIKSAILELLSTRRLADIIGAKAVGTWQRKISLNRKVS
jgi:hypothetical protein